MLYLSRLLLDLPYQIIKKNEMNPTKLSRKNNRNPISVYIVGGSHFNIIVYEEF